MHRLYKPQCKRGFSLVEVLVTTGLLLILAAMLLPVLGKARESARYTAWTAMSNSMAADPRMALYYNFQGQAGDEISARGEPIVQNKSQGDPMGLVASKESMRGADDPELRYGVIKESHPDDDTKGELPYFEQRQGRFRASSALRMTGEKLTATGSNPDVDFGSGASIKYGNSWSLNKEGGYITPDYWAGVVDKGEFQIGMWIRAEDTLSGVTLATWGDKGSVEYDSEELGSWVQWSTGNPGNSKALDDKVRAVHFKKDGPGGSNWRNSPTDKDRALVLQDYRWHLVVLRLKKPYNRINTGLNPDPRVPELDDVEMSIDGSPFNYQTNFWGPEDSEVTNRRIDRDVDLFVIGASWWSGQNSNYWNKSRFMRGYIDEVMVWQEPTSDEEIAKMYRTGAPVDHTPSRFDSWGDWKKRIREDGRYQGNPLDGQS